MGLAARAPRPDLVLIETSGVAMPAQVARGAALAPGIVIDGVVVLADAQAVRLQTQDRHVGDTVTEQLRQADLLVLNKAEAVDPNELQSLQAWLAALAPRARSLVCSEARVPAEVVLGLGTAEPQDVIDTPDTPDALDTQAGPTASIDGWLPAARLPVGRRAALARASRGQRPAASVFESLSLKLQGAFDLEGLAHALSDPALGLVRVKGMLKDSHQDLKVLQMTGSRWRITAAAVPAEERLLMIGLKGAFERQALEAIVERFRNGK
jgi:G3E family GTPase